MAEDTFYTDEVPGYVNNGIVRVTYKTSTSEFIEDGITHTHSSDHTNPLGVFTCLICGAAVIGDNTDAHTAWHNPGGAE